MQEIPLKSHPSDLQFGGSNNAMLMLRAILAEADPSEELADSLFEWGIALCAKLGIDPQVQLKLCQDELQLIEEIAAAEIEQDQWPFQ